MNPQPEPMLIKTPQAAAISALPAPSLPSSTPNRSYQNPHQYNKEEQEKDVGLVEAGEVQSRSSAGKGTAQGKGQGWQQNPTNFKNVQGQTVTVMIIHKSEDDIKKKFNLIF